MTELVERSIPTLFGGVSRQPDSVRNENQVEECDNALLSVVTGGFEKRPGTQWIKELTNVDVTKEYKCHFINRSSTEQWVILIADDDIRVYDAITGDEETVNILDTTAYVITRQTGVNSTGVLGGADYEYYLNPENTETTIDWAWNSTSGAFTFKVEGSADGTTWNDIATGKSGTSGSFSTTIDAVVPGDHNYIRVNVTSSGGASSDFISLRATGKINQYFSRLTPTRSDFALLTIADYTFIVNRQIVVGRDHVAAAGSLTSTVQTFSDLPTATGSGNYHKVVGDEATDFTPYYVEDASGSVWQEVANPTIVSHGFDKGSMPHTLVRNSSGTWDFSQPDWDLRPVGDDTTAPIPPFVNERIKDLTYFRGRLGVIAGESVYLGQLNDVFNFWPQKAIEVLETDPIDRAASTNQISILQWARAFRKVLFITSNNSQFEMTSFEAFTPVTAQFDLATSYTASEDARPVLMGDVIYFPSEDNRSSVLYEYFYNDQTISNTAVDVTRHVQGYIPKSIIEIAADNTSNTMFVMTNDDQADLYVYRAFFDASEKLQSAWSRYQFDDASGTAHIHGFDVLDGYLVLVIERPDGIHLEQMPIEREAKNTTINFAPLIDQRTTATGVYDSVNGWTTWTVSYEHDDDLEVVIGPSFADKGNRPTVSYPSATTVRATGDYSGAASWLGRPYTMNVQLSKPYVKEDNTAVISGRYQILNMRFQHQDTGFYTVDVTPLARTVNTTKFTGKIIGSGSLMIDTPAIVTRGDFRVPVRGDAETAKIEVKNTSPYPSVITGAAIQASFNETTRAE